MSLRSALLAAVALVAFAANSILCRLALRDTAIDPYAFTTIRIASGAAMLALLLMLRQGRGRLGGDWTSGLALYAYAVLFSLAYLALSAGTGALLLFGAVQLTMFAVAFWRGERLDALQTLGLMLAASGVVWLCWPGIAAPPLLNAALMCGAGIAWGVYSLRGGRSTAALADTAGNFLRALPLALAVSALYMSSMHWDAQGALYAALSGAIASGLGYAIWYAALPGLTASRAATVQLAVPVIAALGGVALLGETLTPRLVTAAIAVLGGIALVVYHRRPTLRG